MPGDDSAARLAEVLQALLPRVQGSRCGDAQGERVEPGQGGRAWRVVAQGQVDTAVGIAISLECPLVSY